MAATESKVTQSRRKLSVFSGGPTGVPNSMLDGSRKGKSEPEDMNNIHRQAAVDGCIVDEWAAVSKVGHVPFNNSKVNQDRVLAVTKCGAGDRCHMFGAFDGHGIRGEDVSTFIVGKLMDVVGELPNFEQDPENGLIKTFENLTTKLALSSVNCAFSGTTAVCSWIQDNVVYTANCGDSRAVLGTVDENGNLAPVALSTDQKPDDKLEKQRILKMNGRVEACKGVLGDPIGPARVWLKNQDMPGLAMSRSFGDDVATSVGVISIPEVTKHEITKNDRIIIWASDGVWEFITNDEAIDIVRNCKTADEAAKALVAESTKRWQEEEEVVDDTSCVVTMLNTNSLKE